MSFTTKNAPEKAKTTKQERIDQRNADFDKYTLGDYIRYRVYKHRVGLLSTICVTQPLLGVAVLVLKSTH